MTPIQVHPTIQRVYPKHSETLFRVSAIVLLITGALMSIYALWGRGIALHSDEWVGRGLYPGVAMAYGADLYEPKSGPHVTLYGPTTALFYLPTSLASDPSGAIWIAYLMNILGLLGPLGYLIHRILHTPESPQFATRMAIAGLLFVFLGVLIIEPTTEGLFRIHADLPAFSFLLLALCFFLGYLNNKKRLLLYATCLCLAFSVCAKLPTLPATFFPFFFLCLRRRLSDAYLFLIHLVIAFGFTTICFTLLYGWDDTIFILFKHISSSGWSLRNQLFDETGKAAQAHMSYLKAIPLLFRFLVMYLAEYWYIALSCIVPLTLVLRSKNESIKDDILLNLCLIYILCLPPCLAALAHFGGVENSLLFANATGIIVLLLGIACIGLYSLEEHSRLMLVLGLAVLLLLPSVRQAKSILSDSQNNPHQQAFEYLRSGKSDVYFGWYPLAHIFHSGKIHTSIEAPIWVGMTLPDEIDFSIHHFPPKAKYLAMGPTGYGSEILKQYLAGLKEISAPPELSGWRLYETIDSQNQ